MDPHFMKLFKLAQLTMEYLMVRLHVKTSKNHTCAHMHVHMYCTYVHTCTLYVYVRIYTYVDMYVHMCM